MEQVPAQHRINGDHPVPIQGASEDDAIDVSEKQKSPPSSETPDDCLQACEDNDRDVNGQQKSPPSSETPDDCLQVREVDGSELQNLFTELFQTYGSGTEFYHSQRKGYADSIHPMNELRSRKRRRKARTGRKGKVENMPQQDRALKQARPPPEKMMDEDTKSPSSSELKGYEDGIHPMKEPRPSKRRRKARTGRKGKVENMPQQDRDLKLPKPPPEKMMDEDTKSPSSSELKAHEDTDCSSEEQQLIKQRRKKRTGGTNSLSSSGSCSTKAGRRIPGMFNYIHLFVFLFVSFVGGGHASVVKTKQDLPVSCIKWLENSGCIPFNSVGNGKWETANETCCSDYPGTSLHCQGVNNIHAACLPKFEVCAGYDYYLRGNMSVDPFPELVKCGPSESQHSARKSIEVISPTCKSAEQPKPKGCDGMRSSASNVKAHLILVVLGMITAVIMWP